MSRIIEHKNCTSSTPVELPYCEGGCMSSSWYSFDVDMMEEKCRCCRPFKTTNRTVELNCIDGTTISHSYIYVDECSCSMPECEHNFTPTTKLSGIF
ncbi:intestinal mucin-like protein [Mantella aurantiaca]